jgi:hypothetical protein
MAPLKTPPRRKSPRPVKAGAPALPASTWNPASGRPTAPQDFKPAQQHLLNQGYLLGDTGADGKWGPKSDAAWGQYTEAQNQPLPSRGGVNGGGTTTSTPGMVSGYRPTRGGLAVPKVVATTGNQTTDAVLQGVPASGFGQQMQAAQQQRTTTVTPDASARAPLPARLPTVGGTTAPAPATVPTTTGKQSLLSKVGSKVAANPVSAVSAALGVAGVVMNATAKDPELPPAEDFNFAFRNAQGMDPAAKAAAREQIIGGTSAAVQPTSPDEGTNAAIRLQGAANSNQQLAGLEVQDQQMLRADQNRVEQLTATQANQNFQQRQQRKLQVYDVLSRKAQSQRAAGTALAQSGWNYAVQEQGAKRQDAEYAAQMNNERLSSEYNTLRSSVAGGTLTGAQLAQAQARMQELQRMAAADTRQGSLGYQSRMQRRPTGRSTSRERTYDREDDDSYAQGGVVRFARGGRISHTVSTGGVNPSRALSAKMQADSAQQQAALTRQNGAQHAAMVREILRIRTRPLPR